MRMLGKVIGRLRSGDPVALALMERLPDREREILKYHLGIGVPMESYMVIAARMGLAPARVRVIETNTLRVIGRELHIW